MPPNRPLDLAVLDMAGTTVYDGDAVHRCLAAALGASGFDVTREQVNAVMGIPKPEAIRRLIEACGVERHDGVAGIHADFQARMREHYAVDPDVRPTDGAEACLRALRNAGLKVALDTGFDRETADVVLARLGWDDGALVDATVTADEVERGRPHPDLILRAMELCNVAEPRRVAKVGDTPADLREGQAVGCWWVIGVTSGSHTRTELAACPHTHLIASLDELPGLLLGGSAA